MGANAYPIIRDLLARAPFSGAVVEIGAAPRGGSTAFFAEVCAAHGVSFWSIDIDPKVVAAVRAEHGELVHAVCDAGERFLTEALRPPGPVIGPSPPIGFLYLDNFDWLWAPELLADPAYFYHAQIRRYRELGLELSNLHSQVAHLRQALAFVPHAAARAWVLFDDTWVEADGTYRGKGGAAVPALIAAGFMPRFLAAREAVLLGRE